MRQETSEIIYTSEDVIVKGRHVQESNKLDQYQDEKYDTNNDAGYMTSSNDSLNGDVSDNKARKLNLPPKHPNLSDEESVRILVEAKTEMKKIPKEKRRTWLVHRLTEYCGSVMPASLVELMAAYVFNGDSGNSMDVKPDWLDTEKFRRGQKLAMDNFLGVFYSDAISLFIVYTFDDGLDPVIFSDMSSTPYTAFKRYVSTVRRMQTWYESDPWTAGTPAYNNIRTVRRIHALVRKKIHETSSDEYKERTSIKDAWCPMFERTLSDLESTLPVPKPGQCPQFIGANLPELQEDRFNQCVMSVSQFAFVGFISLYPKFFGIHDATDEDLEAYVHMWRGLGYLLGIDDEFNFCRGSLEDVRIRSQEVVEYWIKPNFRVLRPEWEHMLRCFAEGAKYYFPVASYETLFFDIARILNLDLPRTYDKLSYVEWIRHNVNRFYFEQGCKLSCLKTFVNNQFQAGLERARSYDKKKHQELKERSVRAMENETKRN